MGFTTGMLIGIADDLELLALMRERGCRQVLIGLESPNSQSLHGVEPKRDWKLQRRPDYEAAVRTIQDHGITVNGCFILGLDGDTPAVFDSVYEFVQRTGLYDVQLTVLTPFPGTPLYARLRRENRIIEDGAWHKCTLFDVNFIPRHMTPGELRAGLIDLASRVYEPAFVEKRRLGFFDAMLRNGRSPAKSNA